MSFQQLNQVSLQSNKPLQEYKIFMFWLIRKGFAREGWSTITEITIKRNELNSCFSVENEARDGKALRVKCRRASLEHETRACHCLETTLKCKLLQISCQQFRQNDYQKIFSASHNLNGYCCFLTRVLRFLLLVGGILILISAIMLYPKKDINLNMQQSRAVYLSFQMLSSYKKQVIVNNIFQVLNYREQLTTIFLFFWGQEECSNLLSIILLDKKIP